jgi:hypothetical protein
VTARVRLAPSSAVVVAQTRCRIVLRGPDGLLRPFVGLARGPDGSVYIYPRGEDLGHLDWSNFPAVQCHKVQGAHFSVHKSGKVHLRYTENGAPKDIVAFTIPPLEQMDAPTYILQVIPRELASYEVAQVARKTDVILDVPFASRGLAITLAVGPDPSTKVPDDKRRVPYPGIDPSMAELAALKTARLGAFYFAVAAVTRKGQDSVPPPPIEAWAPVLLPNQDDYLPRPA